jgi:hypothetical protein
MECSTRDLQFLVTWVHRQRQDLISSGLTESQTRVDYPSVFCLMLRPVTDAPWQQIISHKMSTPAASAAASAAAASAAAASAAAASAAAASAAAASAAAASTAAASTAAASAAAASAAAASAAAASAAAV